MAKKEILCTTKKNKEKQTKLLYIHELEISKCESELKYLLSGIENPKTKDEIKKMIKSLNEDDNMDQERENFSKHFDNVHSDFLEAVKEKHPNITPHEHKLCAYLRMNLSTKEIAQLKNISIRGVEITRYRLRKKLGLSTSTNLFNYLINLK